MDAVGFGYLAEVLKSYGPYGLVIAFLWFEVRGNRRDHIAHQQQVDKILKMYATNMDEMRRMYESNVVLVRGYESLAKDLKDVVIMNTTAVTRMCDEIRQNQYCPMQRLEKKKVEVAG